MLSLVAAIGLPFIPAGAELRPFGAELCLIGTIVAVLLTPFFARRPNVPCALVTLLGLAAAMAALLAGTAGDAGTGLHLRGFLVSDPIAVLWKALLLLFTAGIVLMWFATVADRMHEGDGPEFFTLLLGATLGMAVMVSTSNLLMLFMAVELASLPSYVLAGFRKTHRVGAEASLKYVLFGAATSAVMVYGLTMLYGLYGTLQIEDISAIIIHNGVGGGALLAVAIFGLIIGIGFKISAVPFHFWCPDVFEGASIDVAAFLSVASKGAALTLMLRVLMLIAQPLGFTGAPGISLAAVAGVIGVMGAVTATVGNTAALVQTNIKRLLAYSSIAHAGYMLCALSLIVRGNAEPAGAATGGVVSSGAAQALMLYLAVYVFMNLGAFTAAGLIWRQTGSENINDYSGLGRRSTVLAVCMAAFMFSLVGLPPFAGFVAKLNVMYVLGANGGMWWWLVVVIGINTIFSLYYYARVVRVMFLSDNGAPSFMPNPLGAALTMACALMLVLLLLGFGPLTRLTTEYGRVYVSSPKEVATAGPAVQTAALP